MNRIRTALAASSVAAVALGGVVLAAGPAAADIERRATCGGAKAELSVDKEGKGFEVDADLDRAKPGSSWRIKLLHDGKVFTNVVRTADYEGDVDVERYRADSAGNDTFKLVAKNLDSGASCTLKITTS